MGESEMENESDDDELEEEDLFSVVANMDLFQSTKRMKVYMPRHDAINSKTLFRFCRAVMLLRILLMLLNEEQNAGSGGGGGGVFVEVLDGDAREKEFGDPSEGVEASPSDDN